MTGDADLYQDVTDCLQALADALRSVTNRASFTVKLRKRARYELTQLLEEADAALARAGNCKARIGALAKLVDFVLQDVRGAAEGSSSTSMDSLCTLSDPPLRCLRRCYLADLYDPSRMECLVDRLVVTDTPVIQYALELRAIIEIRRQKRA